MALYTTVHLHNVSAGRAADYAAWYDQVHGPALARLRGFAGADRYEVTAAQIMADIPQPWRFLTVYDFDLPSPEIDIPALGPLIAEAREALLAAGRDAEAREAFSKVAAIDPGFRDVAERLARFG